MEIKLKNGAIDCVSPILSTSVTQEETCEIPVPDNMPDILRTVYTDAVVTVKSKDADTGRAAVSGSIAVSVLYCPEGVDGVRTLTAEMPFVCTVSDSRVTHDTYICAKSRAFFSDASFVTSKKLVARVSLSTDIVCFNRAQISAGTEFDGDDADDIQMLTTKEQVMIPVNCAEKSMVLSDEHEIGFDTQAQVDILCCNVSAEALEQKLVGNKLVLRARADYSALLRVGEEVEKTEYSKEFSQIIELDGAQEDDSFQVWLMPSGTYFHIAQGDSTGRGRIISEIQLISQCVQSRCAEIEYTRDAYMIGGEISLNIEKYDLCRNRNTTSSTELLTQTVDTPEKVKNIIHARATCSNVSAVDGAQRTTVYISAVYTGSDDRIMSLTRRFEVDTTHDFNTTGDTRLSATAPELYAAAGSSGIELRASVEFEAVCVESVQIGSVTGGETVERKTGEGKRRSFIIRRVKPGDSLWQIAKECSGKVDTITELNSLDKQPLESGRLLLIPVAQ
ncbi:MAG: LysM peptidoglycan-binding domain-containing protein [Oscillospiraceae bacterium]|nr:LysM peptidoglycan-binding domain-containing protein [Oscillospiraceae bacterium]